MFNKLFTKKKSLDQVVNELVESWDDEFKASEIVKQLKEFDKKEVAGKLEALIKELPSTKIDDVLIGTYLKYGGKQAISVLEDLAANPKSSPDLLNTIYLYLGKRNKNRALF